MAKSNWKYYGNAGHLIVSSRCRFHLATKVGKYLVSTVGEYFPMGMGDKAETIGLDRIYETMVFRITGYCDCGCGLPTMDGNKIDFSAYNKAGEANTGHQKMCLKWDKRQNGKK